MGKEPIKTLKGKMSKTEFNSMAQRGTPVKLSFQTKDGNESKVISRTKQSFRDEADVNNIIRRYQKTGLLVDPTKIRQGRQAQFGDFSDIQNLPETLGRISEANKMFMALPAKVREKFQNDVGQLLNFVQNPNNTNESIDLGLLPESMRIKDSEIIENEKKTKSKREAIEALAEVVLGKMKGEAPAGAKPAASGG